MHEQIETAHREVGDLEPGRPDHPESRAGRVQGGEARILLLRLAEPQARDGERIREARQLRHLYGLAVPRGTSTLRRHEGFAGTWRMYGPRARPAVLYVPDEDAIEREALAEIQRAVDRVDHPKPLRPGKAFASALLSKDGDVRVVGRKTRDDGRLGGVIRCRREIRSPPLAGDDRRIPDRDGVPDRNGRLGGEARQLGEASAVGRASFALRHRSGRVPGPEPADRSDRKAWRPHP